MKDNIPAIAYNKNGWSITKIKRSVLASFLEGYAKRNNKYTLSAAFASTIIKKYGGLYNGHYTKARVCIHKVENPKGNQKKYNIYASFIFRPTTRAQDKALTFGLGGGEAMYLRRHGYTSVDE